MRKWFFLRGLIRESGHWSGFLERFQEAFPDCEAIALDLPGSGQRFRERSPTAIAGITEAVREEFLCKRGEENYLFALSLGGMVGMQWMHAHPGEFRGAVLLNTSLRGISPVWHRMLPQNYPRILRLACSGDLSFREKNILEITSNRQERHGELEKLWTAIQKERPVSRPNALRQILAALRFHPPREKPAAELLLLNGAGDRLVSPTCSLAIAKLWGVPLEVHPEGGHDLTLDEPEWVIEKVKERFP